MMGINSLVGMCVRHKPSPPAVINGEYSGGKAEMLWLDFGSLREMSLGLFLSLFKGKYTRQHEKKYSGRPVSHDVCTA